MKHLTMRNSALLVKVDDHDYQRLSGFTWTYSKASGRPTTSIRYAPGKSRNVPIHRLIMPRRPGLQIDHVNGDPLDNRRVNLRYATMAQNAMNRRVMAKSGFKGVFRPKNEHKWYSKICLNWKQIVIGYYYSPIEAALAYDMVALMWHKEFARTNIITNPYINTNG